SEGGKYAWLEMHLSAEAEKDAKIAALEEKIVALEAALDEAKANLSASAEQKIDLEGYVKVEDYNALAETVDTLVAEAEEKAKHERKSVPGIQLLAKYEPLGNVTDLQATIEKIKGDNTLSAVEKAAKI